MNIKDIDNKLIDRLWKGEAIAPSVLWEAFWSLTEEQARRYVKGRWYEDRYVRENHVTRKLKRFWPAIDIGVNAHRAILERDPTFPKVYRVFTYASYNANLCYVAAGSEEEARRTAEILLPVSAGEESSRYVSLEIVCPQDEVPVRVASGNAYILAGLNGAIADKAAARDRVVSAKNEEIRKIQSRVDGLGILLSSLGAGSDDETAPSIDPIAENPNENNEVPF